MMRSDWNPLPNLALQSCVCCRCHLGCCKLEKYEFFLWNGRQRSYDSSLVWNVLWVSSLVCLETSVHSSYDAECVHPCPVDPPSLLILHPGLPDLSSVSEGCSVSGPFSPVALPTTQDNTITPFYITHISLARESICTACFFVQYM